MATHRLTKAQADCVEDMIRMCNRDNAKGQLAARRGESLSWYEPKIWCDLNGKRIAERIGKSNRWRRLYTVRR